ncbi:MAG: 2-phosphosulfolactate phosphatase [Bacteroidales bacterium]|nr:2-phosphosulfolactate phosphatase [Bacteroidales bacterium]
MEVRIKSCIEGAKESEGFTVIIDVFRASNTIIACLGRGADYVIPVGSLDEAYRLKEQHPAYMLAGERKSMPPEGFDFGNTPAYASSLNLNDKKIIFTTSAGTQGIVNAKNADEILIGSFANASAIVEYLLCKNPEIVTLAAMGFESSEKAEEDEQCAFYLKELLSGRNPDPYKIKEKIIGSKGAMRLKRLGREDDLKFALKFNIYPMLPIYESSTGRIKAYVT